MVFGEGAYNEAFFFCLKNVESCCASVFGDCLMGILHQSTRMRGSNTRICDRDHGSSVSAGPANPELLPRTSVNLGSGLHS